jgi:hypothetical protein
LGSQMNSINCISRHDTKIIMMLLLLCFTNDKVLVLVADAESTVDGRTTKYKRERVPVA